MKNIIPATLTINIYIYVCCIKYTVCSMQRKQAKGILMLPEKQSSERAEFMSKMMIHEVRTCRHLGFCSGFHRRARTLEYCNEELWIV